MKKLLSKIFVALAIIGMVTFIAPKKAMAESQPDCITVDFTCPDGSQHGAVIICNETDILLYLNLFCNIQIKPVQD